MVERHAAQEVYDHDEEVVQESDRFKTEEWARCVSSCESKDRLVIQA